MEIWKCRASAQNIGYLPIGILAYFHICIFRVSGDKDGNAFYGLRGIAARHEGSCVGDGLARRRKSHRRVCRTSEVCGRRCGDRQVAGGAGADEGLEGEPQDDRQHLFREGRARRHPRRRGVVRERTEQYGVSDLGPQHALPRHEERLYGRHDAPAVCPVHQVAEEVDCRAGRLP